MTDDYEGDKNQQIDKSWLYILTLSLAVLFFLQGARELIGTIYNFNLATMSINNTILCVFGFMSPALYPILKKLNQKHVMIMSGILITFSRILMSSGPGAEPYLLFSFLLVSSTLIFIVSMSYLISNNDSAPEKLAWNITLAVLFAVCLDTGFRATGGSFDISIYGFTDMRATSLLLTAPLAAIFFYSMVRFQASLENHNISNSGHFKFSPLFGINLGLLLFIYMVFSGYPNCCAGWTATAPYLSYIAFSASLVVFIVLFYLPVGRNFMLGEPGLILFNAILAATFILLIIDPAGTLSAVLLPISIFCLMVLFYNNINTFLALDGDKNKMSMNIFLSGFVFVLFVFMSVLTLTWAHVPGTAFLKDMMSVLTFSAALACIMFTYVLYKTGSSSRPEQTEPTSSSFRSVFVMFCVLTLVCTSIFPVTHSEQARPISPGSIGDITVMTYNIHQGYGMDGLLDPWEILKTIEEINPDILVLQESETNRLSSMNVDILNWLAYKLEMYVYSGPAAGEQIYGLALLSKYEITDSELYWLESIEDQRVWFRCQVQVGGEIIAVYGIHVGLSPEDRTSQSNEVVQRLANETMPFIMMGDFNTWPNETIYSNLTSIMHDAWILAGHELNGPSTYTFDSAAPYERIDYIFVSDELVPAVNSCQIMNNQLGSDHLPVWAELTIG